jgi:hypothetical protein
MTRPGYALKLTLNMHEEQTMKNTLFFYTLMVILLALSSITAFADSDNYPAAECVVWNSAQPTPSLSSSRVFNTSTSRMYLDCPAHRTDFDGFLHNSAVESSWVSAIDRNTSDSVCAMLVKYRHTGFSSTAQSASGGWQCTTVDSGASLYAQRLNTGSLALGHSDYHLYFSVRVPGSVSGANSGVVT